MAIISISITHGKARHTTPRKDLFDRSTTLKTKLLDAPTGAVLSWPTRNVLTTELKVGEP
jgi:hypothetical protein